MALHIIHAADVSPVVFQICCFFFVATFLYCTRVHTDAQAAKTAMDLNSQAFTVGKDVVFGSGQYNTYTSEGQRLLAHELAHVVQQTGEESNIIQNQTVNCNEPYDSKLFKHNIKKKKNYSGKERDSISVIHLPFLDIKRSFKEKTIQLYKQKSTKRAKPEGKIVGVDLSGVPRVIFDGDYNKTQMWNILFKSRSFGKVKTHDWCYSPEDLPYIEEVMKRRREKFNPQKCRASQVIQTLTSRIERALVFKEHAWDLAKPFMREEVLKKIKRLIKESEKSEEERKKKKYLIKERGYQSLEDLTNFFCRKGECKIVAVAEKEGELEPIINKLKFLDMFKVPVDFPVEHKDFVVTAERKYIQLKPKTFIIDNLTFIGYNKAKGGWLFKDFNQTLNQWTLTGWSTEACAKNIGDKIYNDKTGNLKRKLSKRVVKP